jgi:hypothetical protein
MVMSTRALARAQQRCCCQFGCGDFFDQIVFGLALGVVIVVVAGQERQEHGLGLGPEDEDVGEEAVADGVEGGLGLTLWCGRAVGLGPVGPGGSALGFGTWFRHLDRVRHGISFPDLRINGC